MRGVKHFINERTAIVTEALDAAVMLGEGKVARLDGYPAIKVLVRTDADRARVAVISGGGAGHEPAHAAFVGDGMLTAAVCGEIFASPSVDAVLAAILAVTGDAGCLLIVKSYTGDRLNFGLAAERARALGLNVETVIVADDVAIAGAAHPRGLAGTLFVHKVAGHLARIGASLTEVKAGAQRVADGARTLGLSLSSVSIPGAPNEARLSDTEAELGLGIHGEPGAEKIALGSMRDLAKILVTRLEASLPANADPLAVLVNDLGGVPPIEMAVATHSLLGALSRDVALVFGPQRLMTSLDMKGLSVTLLPLDDALRGALLSEVGPSAWSAGRAVSKVAPLPLSPKLASTKHAPSANPVRRALVEKACRTLVALESELNALDAKVGDGDTGSTFATAARALLADLDALPFADAPALCAAIAEHLSKVMGGSSGILMSIGFAAMGAALTTGASPTSALAEGLRRIEQYGGAHEGDRTMLDALWPAVRALESGGPLTAAATAAAAGAAHTASLTKARAGRSSYVPDAALKGIPDPGAVAMAKVLESLAR